MKLDKNQIAAAVAEGAISALSLDTSVFEAEGNRFEHGLLAQLNQFHSSPIKLILSDVVKGELSSHVARDAAEAQSKARAALRVVGKTWQVSRPARSAVEQQLFGEQTPEDLANRRVHAFLASASVELVESAGRVDVGKLLEDYFGSNAPFGTAAQKKNEFPDAIALQALDHWAAENEVIVLVVSKDNGWLDYCGQSENLVAIDNLAEALSCFQHSEVICLSLNTQYKAGELDLDDALHDAVFDAVDSSDFIPESSAGYFYEADVVDINLEQLEVDEDPDGNVFTVVARPKDSTIVVAMKVHATFEVTSEFSFSITDPIDRDEVPIGSTQATMNAVINARVLLTLGVDPMGKNAELVETEVEMPKGHITLEYGDLQPDTDWDESE